LTREDAVEALGRSLLDYLPQARQPSSTLGTAPGLAAANEKPCETCGARGRVTTKGQPCAACSPLLGAKSGKPHFGVKHGCRPCLICDGWGWVRSRTSRFDGYAREPIDDQSRADNSADLAARLARSTMLLAEWERPETVGFAWERRREQQWRSGDYQALTKALQSLERIAPRRASVWWRKVVLDEPLVLSHTMKSELRRTTEMLCELMPDRDLRVPRHLQPSNRVQDMKVSLWRGQTTRHERMRESRDGVVVEQRGRGMTSTEIAAYHGMTRRHVNRILSQASVMA
jgi:hypothetical protein